MVGCGLCLVWKHKLITNYHTRKRYFYVTALRLAWLKVLRGCVLLWVKMASQWRHNGLDGVSNHQPRDCLPDPLFRRRSKKTTKHHRWPVNSPYKWPVTRKMFPFDDVTVMTCYSSTKSRKSRWLRARLQYLLCVSNADTVVLHEVIDLHKNKIWPPLLYTKSLHQ